MARLQFSAKSDQNPESKDCHVTFNCRAAVEELLKEAQRGSNRAEVGGALAWKKPPKVNHRLFKNTLAQAVVGNIRKDQSKPLGDLKRKHK